MARRRGGGDRGPRWGGNRGRRIRERLREDPPRTDSGSGSGPVGLSLGAPVPSSRQRRRRERRGATSGTPSRPASLGALIAGREAPPPVEPGSGLFLGVSLLALALLGAYFYFPAPYGPLLSVGGGLSLLVEVATRSAYGSEEPEGDLGDEYAALPDAGETPERGRGQEGRRPRSGYQGHVEARIQGSLEAGDPVHAIQGLAWILPPLFYLVDGLGFGLGVPVLFPLAGLTALVLALRLRGVEAEEGVRKPAATLLLVGTHLLVWWILLAWAALGLGDFARRMLPLVVVVDSWWVRGLALPLAGVHLVWSRDELEAGLASGLHALLRRWHRLVFLGRRAGRAEVEILPGPVETPGAGEGQAFSGTGTGTGTGTGDGAGIEAAPRCPVCDDELAGHPSVRCSLCGTPHHRDCWEFTGRCSTYACGGTRHED